MPGGVGGRASSPPTRSNNESSSYVWLTRKQANRMDDEKQLIMDEMPCIERVYQNKDFG